MIGSHFYHETTRNIVVAFGTMFNQIDIVRKNNSGAVTQSMKVPLAYGPKQKWLARLSEDPELNKKVAVTLPRIGFEIRGLEYDPVRKLNKVMKMKKVANGSDNNQIDSAYTPVPYNLTFELYVMAKNSDDALQIVEQILPYFQPEYTITIREIPELETIRDVPIQLDSISYEDNYESEFTERRAIIYTLTFTAKYYLYGPVTSQKVIKTVQVDQYTDVKENLPKREQRYKVSPDPVSADADDDFGFNEEFSFFQDAKEYNPETGQDEDA
jgi:hypothetical protein